MSHPKRIGPSAIWPAAPPAPPTRGEFAQVATTGKVAHRASCLHDWQPAGAKSQRCVTCGARCSRDADGRIVEYDGTLSTRVAP